VVGAGSIGPGWGNGKATAVTFAREGAQVFCVDRNAAAAEETVKIIASEFQTREHLEALQNLGFDVVNRVKIQANVHNKGIVVDGAKVLVSSQNWSTAGVLENRDAGVIVDHAGSAAYFQAIFLHDWNTLGQHKLGA